MFDISQYIPELPFDSWWFLGAVLATLIVTIGLVIRFVSSESEGIDPVEIDRQMLSSVRELTRTGEITEDEYRSIKGRLVDRLKPAEEGGEPKKLSQPNSSSPPGSQEPTQKQKAPDHHPEDDATEHESKDTA